MNRNYIVDNNKGKTERLNWLKKVLIIVFCKRGDGC